jgi:hypothetical protein
MRILSARRLKTSSVVPVGNARSPIRQHERGGQDYGSALPSQSAGQPNPASLSTAVGSEIVAQPSLAGPLKLADQAAELKPKKLATLQETGATVVHLDIQHRFDHARVSIWVDDRLAYETSVPGAGKKRFLVFQRVGKKPPAAMIVPAGEHRVRVQAGNDCDSSETLSATLQKGSENILYVKAEERGTLQLRMQRLRP